MNKIKVPDQNQLATMSTEDLKAHFAESLEYTAKHLIHLGNVWLELERRGEDLSDLKKGLAVYIPMIAHHRLDAKLVIRYAGQKTLLSALSQLPIEEQKKLADSGTVPIFDPQTEQEKVISLSDLSAKQIPQIFTDSGIRNLNQQIAYIATLESKQGKKNLPGSQARRARKIHIDADDKVLEVSNARADLDRVITVLGEFYGKDLHAFLKQ